MDQSAPEDEIDGARILKAAHGVSSLSGWFMKKTDS